MSRLQEIRERLEAATPGPWLVDGMNSGHSQYEMERWVVTENGDYICDMSSYERVVLNDTVRDEGEADQRFIAHSRSDVEALLGAVEDVLEHVEACEQTGHRADADFIKWLINKRLKGNVND